MDGGFILMDTLDERFLHVRWLDKRITLLILMINSTSRHTAVDCSNVCRVHKVSRNWGLQFAHYDLLLLGL